MKVKLVILIMFYIIPLITGCNVNHNIEIPDDNIDPPIHSDDLENPDELNQPTITINSNIGGRVISYSDEEILIFSNKDIIGHVRIIVTDNLVENIGSFGKNTYLEFKVDIIDSVQYPVVAVAKETYTRYDSYDSAKFLIQKSDKYEDAKLHTAIILDVTSDYILVSTLNPYSQFTKLYIEQNCVFQGKDYSLSKLNSDIAEGKFSIGDLVSFEGSSIVVLESQGWGIGTIFEILEITPSHYRFTYNDIEYFMIGVFTEGQVPLYANFLIDCEDKVYDICEKSILTIKDNGFFNFIEILNEGLLYNPNTEVLISTVIPYIDFIAQRKE